MRMSLGHGHELVLECNYCKRSISNHKLSCPQLACEEAHRRILNYICPACSASAVDVNDSDYFECRSCHRQFSRADQRDGVDTRLFLDAGDNFLPVVQLPEPGKGIFPSWIAYEEARDRLERADLS